MPEDTQELVYAGCVVPADLLYDVEANVWIRDKGDGLYELGMTDVAQTMCGRLVQVAWKHDAATIKRGRPLAVIESAKWVGPFVSPLTGTIVESNRAAFDADIAIANRDPYGAGWLIHIQADDFAAEAEHFLTGPDAFEHYRSIIEGSGIRCYRCAE
jgi:glycine cleavage system H protein